MGQGLTHIHRFKFPWMDEVIAEPRVFCGIEGFYQPVDHVPYPRNTAAAGMVGQPDIERPGEVDVERYHLPAQCAGISRKEANARAVGYRPVIRAGDVGL